MNMKTYQIFSNNKFMNGIEYGDLQFTVQAKDTYEAYFKWLRNLTKQFALECDCQAYTNTALKDYQLLKHFKRSIYPSYLVKEI